jgi:hypothetical protein
MSTQNDEYLKEILGPDQTELVENAAHEVEGRPNDVIVLTCTPKSVVSICSALQLASRHPALEGTSLARDFDVLVHLCTMGLRNGGFPHCVALVEAGNNRGLDTVIREAFSEENRTDSGKPAMPPRKKPN